MARRRGTRRRRERRAVRKSGPQQAAFNRLSLGTREILRKWREASGSEAVTLAASAAAPGASAEILKLLETASDPEFPAAFLVNRFRQFVRESFEIIPAAAAALAHGDLAEFGRQVDASQSGAEEGLGNQSPRRFTWHTGRARSGRTRRPPSEQGSAAACGPWWNATRSRASAARGWTIIGGSFPPPRGAHSISAARSGRQPGAWTEGFNRRMR